jgi:hypothetical protein
MKLAGVWMESKIMDRLARIVGSESVLRMPEALAVCSYDGTIAEGQPRGHTESRKDVPELNSHTILRTEC